MTLLLRRLIAGFLAATIVFTGSMQAVQAALIGTQDIVAAATLGPNAASDTRRERIAAALARPDVTAQLERLGVDPNLARARVAGLTDEEASRLAATLDSAPAGADLLGAALLVFFVLLVTDILGFTRIFPFTRAIR